MSRRLSVRHSTVYRYTQPVRFGPHRMMFRPRDSHDMRILSTTLVIRPDPLSVHWLYDVFGNSIATARFGDAMASQLHFESAIELIHYQSPDISGQIAREAATYPFTYCRDDQIDLQSTMALHRPDPENAVGRWAAQFAPPGRSIPTMQLLSSLMDGVRSQLTYRPRYAKGTQDPAETLGIGSGTCRDYALLMMEAARSLGFAARFVTGYIYKHTQSHHVGGGATHAWVQIFVPGAGWIEFDPTNGIVGNRDLVRVAVTRDPSQAIPLAGTFTGTKSSFAGMDVRVTVVQNDPVPAGG